MANIHSLLSSPFAMKKQASDALAPLAIKMLKGEANAYSENKEIRQKMEESTKTWIGCNDGGVIAFRNTMQMSDAPAGSIALIRVSGFISQDGGWCSKGLADYKKEMEAAGANRNIKGVILQVNSAGGSIEGVQNFSDFIASYESKYKKPIAAFVDNMADSAGYYIICQAPRIFTNGMAVEIGSIGTMVTLHDYRGMLEMEGIKEIIINASMSANKNKAVYDAKDGDTSGMVQYLDKYNNMFLSTVQNGRGGKLNTSVQANIGTNEAPILVPEVLTGSVYVGNEVIRMGLADEISDMDGVVKYIEQRASEMGINDPQTTVVEVAEESEDDEEEYYMGYYQNDNTIMFKNLSQEALQLSYDAAKAQLDSIATEKGTSSAEYSRKAGEVNALETELELRQYKNKNIELAASLDKANTDLQAAEKLNAENVAKLEKATAENQANSNSELNATVEKLTAENNDLQLAKEQAAKDLEAAKNEKMEFAATVEKLTAENANLKSEVSAYVDFFKKESIQPPVVQKVEFPANDGKQPEGATASKEMSEVDAMLMVHQLLKRS